MFYVPPLKSGKDTFFFKINLVEQVCKFSSCDYNRRLKKRDRYNRRHIHMWHQAERLHEYPDMVFLDSSSI